MSGGWVGNRKTQAERFSQNYRVCEERGCWIWTGNVGKDGYGKVTWKGFHRPHRFSYHHHNGPIPTGILVCHSCDNPLCVNPDHLWLGTPADNMKDRNNKNRQASGPRIRQSLTKEVAQEARQDLLLGMTQKQAASKYGISVGTAHNLKHAKTWHFRA